MHLTQAKEGSKERSSMYAHCADFNRIFQEEMGSLYRLSLMLTADAGKAEQCFVAGLDDCAANNQVFKEWARSWARRVVVKNAIRLITPEPNHDTVSLNMSVKEAKLWAREHATAVMPVELSAVLSLAAFERFVLVMSVLERYSDQDSALLLGCSRENLIAARVRALQQIGRSAQATRVPAPVDIAGAQSAHAGRASLEEPATTLVLEASA